MKIQYYFSAPCVISAATFIVGCTARPVIQQVVTVPAPLSSASHKASAVHSTQMWTPFIAAVAMNRTVTVKEMLESGANPNERDRDGNAALHYAVGGKKNEILLLLLQAKADPNIVIHENFGDPYGDDSLDGATPLILAAKDYNVYATQMLLKYGAKVDARDKAGRSAYWRTGGNLPAVEQQKLFPTTRKIRAMLLAAGANPSPRNNKGQTWLEYHKQAESLAKKAAEKERAAVLREEKKREAEIAKNTPPKPTPIMGKLFQAIKTGDVAAVKKALQAKAPINGVFGQYATEKYSDMLTPLQAAIQLDKPAVVIVLLNAGADISKTWGADWPPLIEAAWQGNPTITKILLDRGADPNILASNGETALMHAVTFESKIECVRLLLAHGADPDIKRNGQGVDYFMESDGNIAKLIAKARAEKKARQSSAGPAKQSLKPKPPIRSNP